MSSLGLAARGVSMAWHILAKLVPKNILKVGLSFHFERD